MEVRFFGGTDCQDCLNALVIIYKFNIDIDYIDAFDEETQDLCDDNNVDMLPHIQFILNNTILFEHIGPLTEHRLEEILLKVEGKEV